MPAATFLRDWTTRYANHYVTIVVLLLKPPCLERSHPDARKSSPGGIRPGVKLVNCEGTRHQPSMGAATMGKAPAPSPGGPDRGGTTPVSLEVQQKHAQCPTRASQTYLSSAAGCSGSAESRWVQDEVPATVGAGEASPRHKPAPKDGAGQELCGKDPEALKTRVISRL